MKHCHECKQPMRLDKKWKSKLNPRTGNYHNIKRYVCDICGMVDTIHGDGSLDEHHTDAAIKEGINEMNIGIQPPTNP